jgi:hypothetical protein
MNSAPSTRPGPAALRTACATLLTLGAVLGAAPAPAQAQSAGAWEIAGRQGLIQVVIVPPAELRNRAAYVRQVGLLCAPDVTCFINFFSNSTGAPVAVPLPDAIAREPTAIFRRSAKQGAETFRWSCRMGSDEGNCF